jgi:Reverse transcriptase (RNA-dependent DNA polymerase)
LTENPNDGSEYSVVVMVRSLRICLVAAELNGLDAMVGDVSSAYLEACTNVKVYFIAGPEFGSLQGHLFVIYKALYGLCTSGAQWHDRFADTLCDVEFFPCKAEPDFWLKDCDTHYENVCVYVNDIMMMGKDPATFFKDLIEKYKYNLKDVGNPSYHLGGDFSRDEDLTLIWGACLYIRKMLSIYELMFGMKHKEYASPMQEKDHPELDLSSELDLTGIRQSHSLIGALQWLLPSAVLISGSEWPLWGVF